MASTGRISLGSPTPLKRSFNITCDTSDSPSGSTSSRKRRCVDVCLPSRPTASVIQPPSPSAESSLPAPLDASDSLYDYPGLEEDMSSIFNFNASESCLCTVAHNSRGLCDPLCTLDLDVDLDFDSPARGPPSSVVHEHDRSSRSRDDFDPALHYAPLDETNKVVACHDKTHQSTLEDVEVEDGEAEDDEAEDDEAEDVDWDKIMQSFEPTAQNSSSAVVPAASSSSVTLEESTWSKIPPKSCSSRTAPGSNVSTPSPQTRNATLQHVSSKPLLLRPFKTFFRIEDMLSHKASLFKSQPTVVFELFARVVYTSRDRSVRKQYFQLRDLLAQKPPYLSGTLVDWESGSQTDLAAAELTDPKRVDAKCYCRCRMMADNHVPGSWVLSAMEIRTTTWAEIQSAAAAVGEENLLG